MIPVFGAENEAILRRARRLRAEESRRVLRGFFARIANLFRRGTASHNA